MINYYLLTKPGIIGGNLIPFVAGFLLASRGIFYPFLFFSSLVGLGFVIASACVFNNMIDRHIDQKMTRTKNRALPSGKISLFQAMIFGLVLGAVGFLILFLSTNILTLGLVVIGFFIYVVLYSFWKKETIYGTAIGSIAGAVPPLVGYCAVSNQLDKGAIVFFMMMILWQMPHFYAIALYRLKDYTAANLPLLPIQRGVFRTKIHMLVYIQGFLLTASLLTFWNYTGYFYLAVTTSISLYWLWISIKGFNNTNNEEWGRQMFRLSLVLILMICLVIPLDVL